MTRQRVAISSRNVPTPPIAYSPAVKAGGWVFVSGQTATDFSSALAPEAGIDPLSPYRKSRLNRESMYALRNCARILQEAGCDLRTDAVRLYVWVASQHPTYEEFLNGSSTTGIEIDYHSRNLSEVIDQPGPPSTALGVRGFPVPDNKIAMDLIAVVQEDGVKRERFDVPDSPAPIGRYSPALRCGDWVFLAGTIPSDFQGDFMADRRMGEPSALAPEARTNSYMWYGASIELQTEYVLTQLEKAALAAGSSLDRCVKAEVYMGHPQDWYGIDCVWKRWFPHDPPARVVVPYLGLAGKGCRIEIAMTLLANDSNLRREAVETTSAPRPFGHEPQAMRAGDFLFFSTQLPIDSDGRVPAHVRPNSTFPYYADIPRLQMQMMLQNIDAVCQAAGTRLENVCRVQAFYEDLRDLASSMGEWTASFPDEPPALTTIKLGGPLLVPGAHALLDVVAYAP